MIARRAVCQASLGLLSVLSAAPRAKATPERAWLRPGLLSEVPQPALLCLPGGASFACPPSRARLRATLALQGTPLYLLSFALDVASLRQDLLAFISPTGDLLALERADIVLQPADGDSLATPSTQLSPLTLLSTRIATLPDHSRITLQRSGQLLRQTPAERWTDYLRPTQTTLQDAPPRPVRDGTLQQALALERADIAAILPPNATALPHAALEALRSAPFLQLSPGEGGFCGICQKT